MTVGAGQCGEERSLDGAVKTRRTSSCSYSSFIHIQLVLTLEPYRQRHSGLKKEGRYKDAF
jgi:hypothetical protein